LKTLVRPYLPKILCRDSFISLKVFLRYLLVEEGGKTSHNMHWLILGSSSWALFSRLFFFANPAMLPLLSFKTLPNPSPVLKTSQEKHAEE